MPCSISGGISSMYSCSSNNLDYFRLLIGNTLMSLPDSIQCICSYPVTVYPSILSFALYKTKHCQAFVLIIWSTSVCPGLYVRKFYCTVSVILMSAVFNIPCVIKVKHCISPSFISK
jgi:hypothetical protein